MDKQLDDILSTRVPKEISKSIKEIARERNRKIGDIIREAIDLYLLQWADYKIAIERLKDPTDPIISEQEMLDELGWDI